MNIGFVTTYSAKHPAGLERCTLDLLKAVLAEDKENQYLVYTKKGSGLAQLLSGYSNARVIEIGFGKLWKDIGLWFAPRADVYVFNGPQVPIFFSPKRYAVIVYDFAYRQFGPAGIGRWLMDWVARLAFRRAQKIMAISQATKDDVVRLFNINEAKAHVMYLGYADICTLLEERIDVPEKFFLFVSTIKERKNPLNAIKAFAQFHKYHPEYSFIITGKYNPNSEYSQKISVAIQANALGDRVKFVGHVTDSQLAYLYKRAAALVYPSFIEGFGFPILEAMSCGLAVITSDISSLPEIAGEAAFLVDPYSPDSIAQAMSRLVEDELTRQALIIKGKERILAFSWPKTAECFLGVLIPVDPF